jgi:hypothetical protein
MSTYPDLIVQFDKYAQLIRGNEGTRNLAREDLASEVDERLHQLAFIIQQLNDIDAQFGQLVMVEKINESGEKEYYNAMFERDEHLRFVMRLLTESFYYFAFRIRQILQNKIHKFPHMGSFNPTGVIIVRNQLIEHPEGSGSLIFNRTFMWSKETGMHLKTGRQEWESNEFIDAGMKANANEFCEKLNQSLERAINEILREQANF